MNPRSRAASDWYAASSADSEMYSATTVLSALTTIGS